MFRISCLATASLRRTTTRVLAGVDLFVAQLYSITSTEMNWTKTIDLLFHPLDKCSSLGGNFKFSVCRSPTAFKAVLTYISEPYPSQYPGSDCEVKMGPNGSQPCQCTWTNMCRRVGIGTFPSDSVSFVCLNHHRFVSSETVTSLIGGRSRHLWSEANWRKKQNQARQNSCLVQFPLSFVVESSSHVAEPH